MSDVDDLIAACVAAPDDDAPRLVWADAIGGERGELVVIQCKLARGGLEPAEQGALTRRQDELLDTLGKAWSGFEGIKGARSCMFRRGFVEAVEVDVGELHWPTVFDRAPLVTSLSVRGIDQTFWHHDEEMPKDPLDPVAKLGAVLDAPELHRLRGIEIDDARIVDITGDSEWDYNARDVLDHAFDLIARTGKLTGFRALGFLNEYSARGLHELIGSNALATVERFRTKYGETPRDVALQLFAAMPNLRALDDFAALQLDELADILPPSIIELRSIMTPPALAALSSSPIARTLERLGFSANRWMPQTDTFGPFPSLRALDFSGINDGNKRDGGAEHRAAVDAFARLQPQLPALRELRLVTSLSHQDLFMLAEAFGPHLAHFEIPAYLHAPVDELRKKIAGHVAEYEFRTTSEHLLHPSVDTREPWLCYTPVELQRY